MRDDVLGFVYCKLRHPTDNVRYIATIGESPGGPVTGSIDAVRRCVSPSGGGQIVVVPVVHERIAEDEEGTCRLRRRRAAAENR